ncbi:hypothetical protein AB0J86_08635 [Micromonospora sp. NPDC049559]|uniref:hypothetical protein n=1 Tax=Micromonospora sp. NPDC049559 TaxID=3155923 RepID=UPI003412457A
MSRPGGNSKSHSPTKEKPARPQTAFDAGWFTDSERVQEPVACPHLFVGFRFVAAGRPAAGVGS